MNGLPRSPRLCPLYPHKRSNSRHPGTSESCQEETSVCLLVARLSKLRQSASTILVVIGGMIAFAIWFFRPHRYLSAAGHRGARQERAPGCVNCHSTHRATHQVEPALACGRGERRRTGESSMRKSWTILAAIAALAAATLAARAETTLRAVMHSDLKIVDPIWTTAYISRNHGYMIYDTLFAMDEKGEIKPQMVDKYDESADKLTYTFTLRDGLLWHDGTPVTAEDCVASIRRWAAKDAMAQVLMTFVKDIVVVDQKTFRIS